MPTDGLSGGETIQFAEGRWPGTIGAGVAMTEMGFDLVEPHLKVASPDWTYGHRYGVFELSPAARATMVPALRSAAAALRMERNHRAQADLLKRLSDWLEARLDERQAISVLGI
jgi:hypothetical protein